MAIKNSAKIEQINLEQEDMREDMQENSSENKQEENIPGPVKQSKTSAKTPIKLLIAILVIIAIVAGSFYYYRYTKTDVYKQKKEENRQATIIGKAGKLILLPTTKPQFYDVTLDPEKLISEQPFFKGILLGDVVLIYPEISKAVIYSPSRNIVINAGPITNTAAPQANPTTTTTTDSAKKK